MMAWYKRTIERGGKKFLIATETLTYTHSGDATEDLTGSAVDFLVPGKDWVLLSNTGATDLSSDADIAVLACATTAGTYALLKDDLESTIDAAQKASIYDISANGEAPFYKIFIDADGVMKKTDTVAFTIIQQTGSAE